MPSPPPLQSCKPNRRRRNLDVALGSFKMINKFWKFAKP